MTFLHTSDAETRKMYPFDYELRITYTLQEMGVAITYDVTNTSNGEMLFSIGSHEGYDCPEGIEAYDVVFEKEEVLENALLDGAVFSGKTQPILTSGNVLPLKEADFLNDALIFKNIQSKKASIVNRTTGQTTTVLFPECEYLLLWHPVGAPFMCIEPWQGICSTKGDSGDITEKEGIIALESKVEKVHTHIIEFR